MNNKLEQYKNYLIILKKSLTYYQRIKDFYKFLEEQGVKVEEVTEANILDYLAKKNFSINSINTFIKAGKHFYKSMYTSSVNPFNNQKMLRVEKKIPNYFTEAEFLQGVNYTISCSKSMNPYKITAILYFLIYTGLRKGEMISIKRKDIDLTTDPITITVRTPNKYNKERITCFPRKYLNILEKYFASEEEVTSAFNVERWNIDDLIEKFKRAFPNKKLSAHSFRHSFAKHLIQNGADITVVSKLLGHSNISTTLIYVNPDEDMIKSIYKKNI